MLVRLFVLISLFGLSYAVSCNSVTPTDGITYPTGVCIATEYVSQYGSEISGRQYVCDSTGTAKEQYFGSLDCSGTASSTNPLSGGETSICGASPCEYVLGETWTEVTQCDGTSAVEYSVYTSTPFVQSCITSDTFSFDFTCQGGVTTQIAYFVADCTGEGMSRVLSKQCSTTDGASEYTCGLVAPDGTTNTDPTPQPTYEPGTAPSSCNSVTLTYSGVTTSYPIGVCSAEASCEGGSSSISSSQYVCDSSGTAKLQYFDTLDCTGTATQTVDVGEGLGGTYICDSSPCEYALTEEWLGVTQCNGDTPAAYSSYSSAPLLFSNCFSGYAYSCSSDVLTLLGYTGADCSGELSYQFNIDSYCSTEESGAAAYTCGLVASGGTNTGPTQPTFECRTTAEPTPEPSTAEPTTPEPTAEPTTGAPTGMTDNPTTAEPTPPTENPTTAEPTTARPTNAPITAEPTDAPEASRPSRGHALQGSSSIAFFVFSIVIVNW